MDVFDRWGLDNETMEGLEPPLEALQEEDIYRESLIKHALSERSEEIREETSGKYWWATDVILISKEETLEHELIHRMAGYVDGKEPFSEEEIIERLSEAGYTSLPEGVSVTTDSELSSKYQIPESQTWAFLAETDEAYEKMAGAGEWIFWRPFREHWVDCKEWEDIDVPEYYGIETALEEALSFYLNEDNEDLGQYYEIDPYLLEDSLRRLDSNFAEEPYDLIRLCAFLENRERLIDAAGEFEPPSTADNLFGSIYNDPEQHRLTEYTN